MKWNGLSIPRALLIAGAVALLLFVGLVVLVVGKHAWASERLAELEPRFARLAGIEASGPALDAALAERRALLGRRAYAPGMDVARAGSDAQQRARDLFTKAGMEVASTQVLAPKPVEGFDRIPIVLRVDGDLAALQSALAVLSAQAPTLHVEGLNVQAMLSQRNEVASKLAVQVNLYVLREIK